MGVTMRSEAPEPAAELRLHRWSWLFVLLTQLRKVAVPLLALFVFGRGEWWEALALLGAFAVALYALVYSRGFRYRIGADELVIREGILARTVRHVPFARVQNVVQRRSVLHRAFGVTELRIESAGGAQAEAAMNVITLAEAGRLERILRGGHAASPVLAEIAPLLALDTREVVRLGLLSNRGMVVVGAFFAFWFQFEPWERGAWRELFRLQRGAFEAVSGALASPLAILATGLVALLGFVILLRVLSVAIQLLRFHDFRLTRDGERISTDSGLLTRTRASATLDRIQRLRFGESWLARYFKRRWLSAEVAGGALAQGEAGPARLKWLAPIATPERIAELVGTLQPEARIEALDWRPLHPRAFQRMVKPMLLSSALACAVMGIFVGAWALAIFVAAALVSIQAARGRARFGAYALDARVVAARSGWLGREWSVVRTRKIQVLRLERSPFDRRHGMAAVRVDTAGADPISGFRVAYLAEPEARALFEALRAGMARD